MQKKAFFFTVVAFIIGSAFTACGPESTEIAPAGTGNYEGLVTLFNEFREFQRPKEIDGVPDYTASAMSEQYSRVREYQQRLAALDIGAWPVAQQVDYHVVRAEMNGLEFEHRVRKPWTRDPAFYLFSQGGAGPVAYGRPRLSELPMSPEQAAAFKTKLQAVPGLLLQARGNLSEAAGDLARFALHFLDDEIRLYTNLGERLTEHHPDMIPDVEKAAAAVEDYGTWLEANISSMTAQAGIGKENYNWWLKNVHLVPYTWDELYASLEREYEHSFGALKIVEHRNRDLPPLELISSAEEYLSRWSNDERYMLDFIQDNNLFTVPDYVTPYNPGQWWNARERNGIQDFFEQCRDRDMIAEVAHNALGHHIDGLMYQRDDRPIRGSSRLYDIDMIRNEGMAFGLEEIFLHAGIYEKRPRGEEINLIAKAFRAVRGLADLNLHSNEFDLSDALRFCYEETPYNWMIDGGYEVWHEMQTTLRAPGWHMGMVLGKIQMMSLIEDVAKVRGDDFVLGEFVDDFRSRGMIPMSLVRWEMTGLTDEMDILW
jgi:hypothetical protein